MNRYIYKGAIMLYGKCVADRWQGETLAATKDKAVSNLKFQARKALGLQPQVPIIFTADVLLVRERKGA